MNTSLIPLKFLVGNHWLSSDLWNHFTGLLNSSSDDTHCIYFKEVILSNPEAFARYFLESLKKIICCLNV